MIKHLIYKNSYFVSGLFLLTGLCLIVFTQSYPIGDFGNYYYGSRLFMNGKFSALDYQSISHFNQQISNYGESHFFENYTPVPPFSLLFYLPLAFLSCLKAKFIFNVISLFVFCFSLQRLFKYCSIEKWQISLIPLIFLYPFYNCIHQGQTYLLITAFLIESFLASEKSKYWISALYLSLCVCLKIFPIFAILYFVLKKEYRVAIYSLLITVVFYGLTMAVVGTDIILYYFKDVLPRLLHNDIIGTYYHGNQSIYTFLLNVFSLDENQNSHPFVNFPWLVPVIEGIIMTIVLVVLIAFRKKSSLLAFGFILFCSVLIGRYNTTYGMLILIPFMVAFISDQDFTKLRYVFLVIVALAISSPIGYFLNSSLVFQFSRLAGLVFAFGIFWLLYKPTISSKLVCVIGVIVISLKCFSFSIKPIQYFSIQNSKGILYDYVIQNDSIKLISTMGDKDFEEFFPISAKAFITKELYVKGKDIIYKNKIICSTKDHKMKPFLYKDSSIVFLSDMNQAIGFYKLQIIRLK